MHDYFYLYLQLFGVRVYLHVFSDYTRIALNVQHTLWCVLLSHPPHCSFGDGTIIVISVSVSTDISIAVIVVIKVTVERGGRLLEKIFFVFNRIFGGSVHCLFTFFNVTTSSVQCTLWRNNELVGNTERSKEVYICNRVEVHNSKRCAYFKCNRE